MFFRLPPLAALCGAILATGLVVLSAAPGSAADLDWRSGRPAHFKPPYFSLYEPWSVTVERPPRKGFWYDTSPIPGAVNGLIPMNPAFRVVRPEPWTPAWVAWCTNRWPSFNPNSGTIVTPDGVRMCR